jgi:hypothetical protein
MIINFCPTSHCLHHPTEIRTHCTPSNTERGDKATRIPLNTAAAFAPPSTHDGHQLTSSLVALVPASCHLTARLRWKSMAALAACPLLMHPRWCTVMVVGVDGWWVVSDAIVGRMAIERWIFAFCNFQLRACKILTPTKMVTARPPDVLTTSRVSFHSAVMCRKRLPIGVGEWWSEEHATSWLRQKGHFSVKSAKGHFTCRTRMRPGLAASLLSPLTCLPLDLHPPYQHQPNEMNVANPQGPNC